MSFKITDLVSKHQTQESSMSYVYILDSFSSRIILLGFVANCYVDYDFGLVFSINMLATVYTCYLLFWHLCGYMKYMDKLAIFLGNSDCHIC